MAYGKKWKPSKTAARGFAQKMDEIRTFCAEKNIDMSIKGDSYYFRLNGKDYRVSNHSVEASNAKAYDEITGEKLRTEYHPGGREADVIYIHAGKTRIIEIYNDLANGYKLNGRGERV